MAQINNNAESLSRELRKFKNLKSIDYKGLLSGTPESYVNLYRFLFCENNIGFSHFVIDKGYDLSGLNDYKFMEAVYRMMRDLLNAKPPINQNQFFSPGFTQRKLEMSTIIAAQVRKITNEITNKTGKKSVQTPSLMKSSLKRPNSAQKQTRIIEMGDESDSGKHKSQFQAFNKVKPTDKYSNDKKIVEIPQKGSLYGDNYRSSDELSEESDVVGSYNSQSKANEQIIGNNYEIHPKIHVEKADTTSSYNSRSNINENITRNNYESHYQPPRNNPKYSSTLNYKNSLDSGDISAFETNARDTNKYNSFNSRNTQHDRMYDMKQYAPSQHNETLTYDKDRQVPELEKVMQQFDTVLARITLLESRMQRIETKLEHSSNGTDGYHHAPQLYQGQGNHSNSEYIPSYNQNDGNRSNSYFSKNTNLINGTKEAIPDFEVIPQHTRAKLDSDRSYSSSTYSTNYKSHIPNDYSYTAPRYVTNFTNYSEKRNLDLVHANGARDYYLPVNATFNSCPPQGSTHNESSTLPTEPYQTTSISAYKSSQPTNKTSNGIPPLHPKTTKKFDDPTSYKSIGGKQSEEKVFSQTDRIASMLSDTQKMLRLSDEEL